VRPWIRRETPSLSGDSVVGGGGGLEERREK
jgi:hypothetical protein